MKQSLASLLAAAALGFGSTALAQEPTEPPAHTPTPEAAQHVSDEDLDTFADIYLDLQETLSKFEAEAAAIETEQEAAELQARVEEESLDKIAEHGWTLEMYNGVVQAINADPDLAAKTLQLIQERS